MSSEKYPAGPPPPYSPNSQAPIGFANPGPQQQQPPQQHTVYVQPQSEHSSVHVVQQQPPTTTYVIPAVAVGVCPACRVGVLSSEFTCCGIFLGILFFPIGMLCCFLMMEKRCSNCRAIYG